MNFYNFLYNSIISEKKPSDCLIYLKENGLISNIAELQTLIGTPQDPQWHPEGDVWAHTLLVIDYAATLRDHFELNDYVAFILGALCHDIGKPYTTIWDKGRWRSPQHDVIGTVACSNLLLKMKVEPHISNVVIKYVVEHLRPMQLYKVRDNVSKQAIINLEKRIHIPHLIMLATADHLGRTTEDAINKESPHCQWLMDKYTDIFNL